MDEVREQLTAYDSNIHRVIGNNVPQDDMPDGPLPPNYFLGDEWDDEVDPIEAEAEMPEADAFDAETYDQYIAAEVMLPTGGELTTGKVTGRKRDQDGNPIGLRNSNPILDTRVYEVQFPDGHAEEFAANVIAESLYSQVDDEGNQYISS